ncbi:MAG: FG-GAP repeat protein [Bryobacteraceae bacterium]
MFVQQGGKLIGSGALGAAQQGSSVAISADGSTALVGGPSDNSEIGAVWVFTRDAQGNWSQQGGKLLGSGAIAPAQGNSVALSADGNTALVGGFRDNGAVGAVWVFARDSNGIWSQQGDKLVGSGAVGNAYQGSSVALSGDGNTALVGGDGDYGGVGAVWVFTRDRNGAWTQQGSKLGGSDDAGTAGQGYSVSLSADGNTALESGPVDNTFIGAAWVFTRDSSGNWTQQGSKLVGIDAVGTPYEGHSVALSGDGDTALIGGPYDNGTLFGSAPGAVWVFTRNSSGIWTQQGSKLVGGGAGGDGLQGWSVAISGNGNTALVDGPQYVSGGGIWVFIRSAGIWSQQGGTLANPGESVALSADGNTFMVGGFGDADGAGAAWPFVRALSEPLALVAIAPCRLVDTRNPDGPFGGPELAGGALRTFDIPAGSCGIPSSAEAYSLNVTVVPDAQLGYLTVGPSGQALPYVSTLNSDGRVKANAAILPAGGDGAINVFASNSTQVVLDIDGYFVPAGTSTLAFYPLTPCRAFDTRGESFIPGGTSRAFDILSSPCSIPSTAQAYSLNFTAVPRGPLGYLTVWPSGEAQPVVSTLNAQTGAATANAAIVQAGSNGEISVFASNDTDLVIDVNGYFAPGRFRRLVAVHADPLSRARYAHFLGRIQWNTDGKRERQQLRRSSFGGASICAECHGGSARRIGIFDTVAEWANTTRGLDIERRRWGGHVEHGDRGDDQRFGRGFRFEHDTVGGGYFGIFWTLNGQAQFEH